MTDTSSVTEEAGMSLKERRERAKRLLHHWTVFHQIPTKYQEKKVQFKNRIFAALSDPLQVNMEKLLADATRSEDFLELVRAMCGDDAVDFALQVRESWAI